MPPPELISPLEQMLKSVDWSLALLASSVILLAWAAFLTLSGLEGWVLASSLGPWVRGLGLGAGVVLVGGGAAVFWGLKMPVDSRGAWFGLGLAAGVGGLITARVAIFAFWKTWRLRIFLFGGALGLLIYAAAVVASAVGRGAAVTEMLSLLGGQVVMGGAEGHLRPNWPGIARLAIAFAGGGGLYVIIYHVFYPLVWLLRNVTLLAIGAIVLAIPAVRQVLARYMDGEGSAEALSAAAAANVRWFTAVAGGACVIVAYAMWTQNFSRSFRNFSRRVLDAKYGSLGMAAMFGGSMATAFSTVGRMLTLRRSSAEHCRIFKGEEDETEDEDEEKEGESGKKKKAGKRKKPDGED